MNLLLDIGNTRLKALWWEAIEQPIAAAAAVQALHHQGQPAAGLAGIDGPRPRRIAIAQVLGPAAEAALAEACRARGWPAPQFARSGEHWRGLRNGYAEPARLGVDRWLALMAVWARHPGEPALVALAGTALTLDAVDRSGQHLGGFIAPGLWTARQALLGATRFPVGE
ncbi:MAG TPA: type III pantothenate kinase, partial [Nevskiaceae bacterium]|nr:type III pantothenate kinase [Nevskiaceae bacterium]